VLRYHLGWVDQRGSPEHTSRRLHFPPALALASCEALSGDFRAALPAASAIELVYNFTLAHADVQAGTPDRQERPSIWWVWGPAQAINAGDGLHALGRVSVMRLEQRGVPAARVLRGVAALDQACLTLCEGQYMDLNFQDQLMVTSGDFYEMLRRKAGALTGCAAELGALAAGADDAACSKLHGVGSKLGMAWQIAQDTAELWGQGGDGMTVGNMLNKKKSLPLVYVLETASPSTKRELGTIYMKRALEPQDVSRIIDMLDQAGARQYAEDKARELVGQGMAAVEDIGLPSEGSELFRQVAEAALGSHH
jgi:geranylgeranyl diphosphate synthase type I